MPAALWRLPSCVSRLSPPIPSGRGYGRGGRLILKFTTTIKADILAACNGCLAGLMGITAPCSFVPTLAAVVISAIAVPFMFGTAHFVGKVMKVDDAIGAVPVHFGSGIWGLLAVGICADGTYEITVDLSSVTGGSWFYS